jgi:hypothetical protein
MLDTVGPKERTRFEDFDWHSVLNASARFFASHKALVTRSRIVSAISLLLTPRGPSNIARFVVTVVVNAINRVTRCRSPP